MSSKHKSDEFVYDSESGSDFEDAAFEPPKHYNKVPLFTPKTDLANKEIWLIKAPKGFNVSQLKTLPVSFTSKKVSNDGLKSFKVGEKEFQMNEEHFSSDSAKYSLIHEDLLDKKIARYYTLRQVVKIPGINWDKAIKKRKDVPKEKNLKMRHFPTGYSANNFDEAKPIAESRLDEDGKVIKKFKVEPAPEKKEKKEKKDKKEKKEKKEKKDKKKDKKKSSE